MDILKYIIVFFIGLIVGHFNGVFIHILPENKPLNKPFLKYWTSYFIKGIWTKVITGAIFVLLYEKYGLTADFIFLHIYYLFLLLCSLLILNKNYTEHSCSCRFGRWCVSFFI